MHDIRLFIKYVYLGAFLLLLSSCNTGTGIDGNSLRVFAGSAGQPVLKEIARQFELQTGCRVELSFGGSGFVLSQMKLSNRGDVFMPGSSDFMLKAVEQQVVDPENIRRVAYLVPAINVKPGNPKHIRTLHDLTRPGLRVGIARPEQVCLGLYAVELLEANNLLKKVLPNIVITTESCAKTASVIALTDLDAVIGWREFARWEPTRIETVLLSGNQIIPRLGVIPIAVTTMAADPALAERFVASVCSPAGKQIFERWGYLTDKTQALKLAPKAIIGGTYSLPPDWNKGPST
jgi:molybdate transport system substrate-binding protein